MKYFATAALIGLTMANEAEYMEYVTRFSKFYTTREEFEYRMALYIQNDFRIKQENRYSENTFTLDHNQFSDWSFAEFQKMHAYKPPKKYGAYATYREYLPAPNADSVNWVTSGAVTEVKNQGSCGSCWTFSSTGAMEGAYKIDTGADLVDLAEQQLVDCDTKTGNMGCNGGDMGLAFTYAEQNGMMTLADYPYTAVDGTCAYDESKTVMKVVEWKDVAVNDSTSLKAAIADRPVSVAI